MYFSVRKKPREQFVLSHCSITHTILNSSKYSRSPKHNLQFYTSMSVFMLFPLSEIFSCFHQSSVLHKSQNVTTFCEAFKSFLSPSLSHSMEKANMASITLCQCIYYTLFYGSTSVFLPLNQPLRAGAGWLSSSLYLSAYLKDYSQKRSL